MRPDARCFSQRFAVPATSSHSKRCRRAQLRYFDYTDGGGDDGDHSGDVVVDVSRVKQDFASCSLTMFQARDWYLKSVIGSVIGT